MKTITFELTDDKAFDDLVNLDCIAETLEERVKDLSDIADQRIVRSWLKTVYRLRVVYEREVMKPDAMDSLNRYRALVP